MDNLQALVDGVQVTVDNLTEAERSKQAQEYVSPLRFDGKSPEQRDCYSGYCAFRFVNSLNFLCPFQGLFEKIVTNCP